MGQEFGKEKLKTPIFLVWNALTDRQIVILWKTWSLTLQAENVLTHLQFINVGKIMVRKYGYLMLVAFRDKETPDTDLTDEVMVICNDHKWSQINFGVNTQCTVSGPSFMQRFSFLRNWSI